MKDNWIEKMKRKLEGHEMSPPAGLWDSIGKEMGFEQKAIQKPIAIKRWQWAAAAAVLALAGFFTFYDFDGGREVSEAENTSNHPNNDTFIKDENVSEQVMADKVESSFNSDKEPLMSDAAETTNHNTIKPILAYVQGNKVDKVSIAKQDASVQEGETRDDIKALETIDNQNTSLKKEDEEKMEEGNSKVEEQQSKVVVQQHGDSYDHLASRPSNSIAHSSRKGVWKWTVGVNASGGLLVAQNTEHNERIYYDFASTAYMKNESNDFFVNNSNYGYESYGYADYEAKHSIPMRFGLSVQCKLNERFSLLSGLNYTYLHSQFSLPLYDISVDNQNLHYLGIPVGLVCQLWSADHLRLYLSGGGMVEKCLNAKPWQYSVNAAAGAEYAITPMVGCYIEPSLGYYFDDGTSYEHYYKEHPMAPAIEVGIRFHINE